MNTIEQQILQKRLASFIVSDVYNTITEDDILRRDGQSWTFKGNKLTDGQIIALKSKVQDFINSDLWEILKGELRWLAVTRITEKSQTENDLIAGKMLLYLIDVIESKLKNIIN